MKDLEMLKKFKKQMAVLGLTGATMLGGCTVVDHQDKQEREKNLKAVDGDSNPFNGPISRKEMQSLGFDFVLGCNKYERTKTKLNDNEYEYSDWEKTGSFNSYLYEEDTDVTKTEIVSINLVKYKPAEDEENLGQIFMDNEWYPVQDSSLVLPNEALARDDSSEKVEVYLPDRNEGLSAMIDDEQKKSK